MRYGRPYGSWSFRFPVTSHTSISSWPPPGCCHHRHGRRFSGFTAFHQSSTSTLNLPAAAARARSSCCCAASYVLVANSFDGYCHRPPPLLRLHATSPWRYTASTRRASVSSTSSAGAPGWSVPRSVSAPKRRRAGRALAAATASGTEHWVAAIKLRQHWSIGTQAPASVSVLNRRVRCVGELEKKKCAVSFGSAVDQATAISECASYSMRSSAQNTIETIVSLSDSELAG